LIVSAWLLGAAIAGLPMVDGFGFASRTIGNFQGECHFTVVSGILLIEIETKKNK
jgi:hypothetical protein